MIPMLWHRLVFSGPSHGGPSCRAAQRQQLAGPPSDATTGKGLRTLLDWGMDGHDGNGMINVVWKRVIDVVNWCIRSLGRSKGSSRLREMSTMALEETPPQCGGLVDFSHGFSKVSCATEVMTRKVGCDSQLWLGCVPWNLGWKWGKAGRFQISVCSRHDLGWLRMQMDAASDDFFNTDHSMFWCLAIILRCFQPPSWMSFTWPSNCERSATLWRKSLEWTTLLTNLGTFWPLHSWWLICVLLEFPAFQATICCKML